MNHDYSQQIQYKPALQCHLKGKVKKYLIQVSYTGGEVISDDTLPPPPSKKKNIVDCGRGMCILQNFDDS